MRDQFVTDSGREPAERQAQWFEITLRGYTRFVNQDCSSADVTLILPRTTEVVRGSNIEMSRELWMGGMPLQDARVIPVPEAGDVITSRTEFEMLPHRAVVRVETKNGAVMEKRHNGDWCDTTGMRRDVAEGYFPMRVLYVPDPA